MAKFDHFNFLSSVYDLVFGRASQSAIINLADIKTNHSVLDVGGGTGRVAVKMLPLVKCTIIADSALKMLWEAQKKGINAINANAEQLPFENGAFDRIIMVDALHHVADQRQTLDELWRSLKPGGMLVIEEPDIDHWFVKLIALGEKLLLMRSHFLRPQEIKAMCCFIDIKSVDIRSDKGIAWIMMHKDNHLETKE
jgi:ubiquinone/menaquinone biosynthesis C-methylase UbiE